MYYKVTDNELKMVADAIRYRSWKRSELTWPEEYESAIRNIPIGEMPMLYSSETESFIYQDEPVPVTACFDAETIKALFVSNAAVSE